MEDNAWDKIKYNFIMDLRKKDIDVFDRAKIIKSYLRKHNISMHAFAKKTGIPKTTLHGWLLPLKIKNPPKDTSGIKVHTIHKELKYKTDVNRAKIYPREVDNHLRIAISTLRPFGSTRKEYSSETKQLIHELKDVCNRILMYIDMEARKGKRDMDG